MKPKLQPPPGKAKQDRVLGLPATNMGERMVTAYHADMALQVCELIAQGHTLKAITDEKDETGKRRFVSYASFQRWVINYPELRKAYLAARELSAFAFEDKALELANLLASGTVLEASKVRAFDVAMNQLRWSASKRNPREYGERGALNVTVPIQINTGLDLGQGGVPVTVEENAYSVQAIVKKPTVELLDGDQPPLVGTKPQGRQKGFRVNPDMPGTTAMKARRAEYKHQQDIEAAREEAVEIRGS